MRNSEGFDDVNNGDSGDVDEDAGDVVEDAGHGDEDAGDVDEDFQVPHHPLPFPTSGFWFHPLSYDSKVNTFIFIPNEIKIFCLNRYELEISLLGEKFSFCLCFELTLPRCRHSMQVLDEVPMIWGSCYMVYTMHMVGIIS